MSEAITAEPVVAAPAEAAPAAPAPAAAAAPAAEAQSSETVQGEGQGDGNEKPADAGAPAEGEATPPAEEGGEAPGAPKAGYAAFDVPEGIELEGEMLDSLTGLAKAHNLNQTQAQALVDLGVQQANMIAERYQALVAEKPVPLSAAWAAKWSEQTASDPTIGGANLKTTMALATRVFQTFATDDFGTFLNETGLAHHPELIRFMNKVGAAISEDTLVTSQGGQGKGTEVDPFRRAAKKLYANMN
jgi:hypothetical protein